MKLKLITFLKKYYFDISLYLYIILSLLFSTNVIGMNFINYLKVNNHTFIYFLSTFLPILILVYLLYMSIISKKNKK